MKKGGFVYILSSNNRRVLYTGVTADLDKRIQQHKQKHFGSSFSAIYNCTVLVYYKFFPTIIEAIAEEKRIKAGSRKKKEILINEMNPEWKDLSLPLKFWY